MTSPEPENKQIGRRRWSGIRFDMILPVFLLISWSLIFTTATLGLRSTEEQWLPIGLLSPLSGDYTVKASNEPRLARINPEVIEAVKRDQTLRATPTPVALAATATITGEPTITSTLLGSWQVSIGGPYDGQEGSEILVSAELTGSMLNLLPGVVSYIWDLDNDGQFDDANGASTAVAFYDEGVYTVGVQAADLLGQVNTAVTTISVSNVAPLASMDQKNINTEEGQEVVFAAALSDPGRDVLLYRWDFGDDSREVTDTLTPRHVYQDNGEYTIHLTAWDNDGGEAEITGQVTVDNLPPEVEAGEDQKVNEGDKITFIGTATDVSVADTLTYDWDFNYDGLDFTTDATGATVSTLYPNGPKNVVAALRVRDKDGGEALDTVKVTVTNVPPVITSITDDGPAGEGSSLVLTVAATDVGKEDRLSYAFDWNNDGSFEAAGGSNSVSNIWDNQGSYSVRVRVEDGDGGQVFATKIISTFNESPVAVASATSTALEGSALSFDGSDSHDPGGNDVLTYLWDFGDGKSGSGVSPAHVYGDNGVYSATLTVSDDSGAGATAGVGVTILNANPVADAGADLIVDEGPKTGASNVVIAYQGTATDPGVGDILSYIWDFDYTGGVPDAEASGASGTKIYPTLDGPDEQVIALQVRDDDYPFPTSGGGEVGEALDTVKLTVKNLAPWNVNAGGPYVGKEYNLITLTATAEDVPGDFPTLEYAWDLDSNPDFETIGRQVTKLWTRAGAHMVRLRVRDKDGGESFGSALVNIENALPSVTLAYNPITATVLLPVTLVASGSDPANDPLTYRWYFGDGSSPVITTTSTLTHTYSDDRVYTATVQVDDGRGGLATDSIFVNIANLPPVAVANASPTSVVKGSPVVFDATGSTDPDDPPPPGALTYQWNFGDGSNGSGFNVSHTYTLGDVYTATLTITDDNGGTSKAAVVVTVNNDRPTAAITSAVPNPADEGNSITFDGSSSNDPNGDTLAYQWDFGDGTPVVVTSLPTTTHLYQNGPATYNATLTVTDSEGSSSTPAAVAVSVNNVAPTANAGADQTVNEGDVVTFDDGGSSDPGVADTLTYTWDFGDGSPGGTGKTVTHIYPDGPAVHTVTLAVTDSDGATSSDTLTVTVQNVLPTANAGADQTVNEGDVATFNGSGSDAGPNDTIVLYEWDFDYDGANFTVDDNSGPNPTTPAPYPGDRSSVTVALRVTDNNGGVSAIDTLVVRIDNLSPQNASAGGPYTTSVDVPVQLNASATDVPPDVLTCNWDLDNDGSFEISNNPTPSFAQSIAGIYTVVLQVQDNDGGFATAQTIVDVQ